MEKIDFVLLWVDGGDENWLKEKNEYSPVKKDYGSDVNRFRDWDNLQYLFRGIEKYAPWVNNIYFITWGHLPKWLNVNNPKLKIINHKDFIPAEYLPTFNSNTIELNLFRIKELSDKFVIFNDDIFIIDKVKPEDFFENGLPKDIMTLNPIQPKGDKFGISYIILNNMNIINTHFKKNNIIKKNFSKFFNIKYGPYLLRNFLLMPWGSFVGFSNPHIPQPHLKSTFSVVWKKEHDKLDASCRNRFRGLNDLSHWLMRYWNLCTGKFVPRKLNFGKYFNLSNDNTEIINSIKNQKYKVVCVNDMSSDIDFEKTKAELNGAFDHILSEKSSFEI